MRQVLAVLALTLLAACAMPTPPPHTVADLMSGTFSSEAQSAADSENYYPIRLVMAPIWTDRADGPWLYVEQAVATKPAKPYRQRVYHLSGNDGGVIRSEVYAFSGDPLRYVRGWESDSPVAALTPEHLVLREGCTVFLASTGNGTWAGGTRGTDCSSTLGDAQYATSEVEVAPSLITSWDRGFDAAGEQAWGATEGAYRFVRTGGVPSAE